MSNFLDKWIEAEITINGRKLSSAESMAVRVQVASALHDFADPDRLGTDDHGRSMTKLYRESLSNVQDYIMSNQPVAPEKAKSKKLVFKVLTPGFSMRRAECEFGDFRVYQFLEKLWTWELNDSEDYFGEEETLDKAIEACQRCYEAKLGL